MDSRDPLAELLLHLVVLSVVAIGGLGVILPELYRVTVTAERWLTDAEFTALLALSQAAPGPNMLFATLLGWKLGGVAGGVLATLALSGPAALLAWLIARLWIAWGARPWFRLLQAGLAPVTIGLVMSSAWLVTSAAAQSWQGLLVVAAAAALLSTTRTHPLAVFAGAGLLGILGAV